MFAIGDVLSGRYKITEHLRRGHVHDYWLALDTVLERTVVIRARPPDVVKVFGDVLLAEARTLSKLEHPHLLPVYDYGEDQNRTYVVTRYIPDGSLEAYIAQQQISIRDIVRLAERLASALDFLHEQNTVHGDIKPYNILLGKQLHPYISNFFVSSVRSIGIPTDPYAYAGSPAYAAPESYETRELSVPVDIYAFGITLYQCFTGIVPTHRNQPFGMAQLLGLVEVLPSVTNSKATLPIGIDLVLQRLTRRKPAERYATATEATDALSKVFYSGQGQVTGKIFISYARTDKEFVYSLANELRQAGIRLWIDQDIPPGANWDSSVEAALTECDMLLLIASPSSMASNNVQDEWSYYLDKGKSVYTFIYKACELSFRLRRRQYIESTNDLLTDVARIVEMLSSTTDIET